MFLASEGAVVGAARVIGPECTALNHRPEVKRFRGALVIAYSEKAIAQWSQWLYRT